MRLLEDGRTGEVTVRTAQRYVQRTWNLHQLGRVHAPLADAIRRLLTPAEERAVAPIEQLRAEVNTLDTPLRRVDYGSGPRTSGVETVGTFSMASSKSARWCRLLFKLVRDLRPLSCLEMGTAVGISGAYQAAALAMNGNGHLVTLEGDPSLAEIAQGNLRRLGLTAEVVVGRFQDTLPKALKNRPDYVFVDGHHDETATLDYFEQIIPTLADPALVVFDDIAWSDGMRRAWAAITQHQRVALAADLGTLGLCIVRGTVAGQRYHLRIPA
jgi:predicted O-methyltransferase YrrM